MFVPLLILACGSPGTPEPTSAEAFSVLTERLTPNAVALHSTEATYELPKPDWEALGVDPEAIGTWNVEPKQLPRQPKHNSPAYALPCPSADR